MNLDDAVKRKMRKDASTAVRSDKSQLRTDRDDRAEAPRGPHNNNVLEIERGTVHVCQMSAKSIRALTSSYCGRNCEH